MTVSDIIDAFGGPTAFGAVIGKQPSTASEMKRAGSIPGRYWHTIVGAAAERGLVGVSLETLARLHAVPAGAAS